MNNIPSQKFKEPLSAIFFHFIFPGLGQIYAGYKQRGGWIIAGYLGLYFIGIVWALHPTASLSWVTLRETTVLGFFYLAGFLISLLILIDAYRCAGRYNAAHHLERKITWKKRLLLISGMVIAATGIISEVAFLPLTLTMRANLFQAFQTPGDSMAPTLMKDDRALTCKWAYKGDARPQRGDIIVFMSPDDPAKTFVNRIIAQGGETVEIRDGRIYINGALEDHPQIKGRHYDNRGHYGERGLPVTVPPRHYYVLGDNSPSSHDSRYWGFLPEQNILGKVYKIYYPFKRSGSVYGGERRDDGPNSAL